MNTGSEIFYSVGGCTFGFLAGSYDEIHPVGAKAGHNLINCLNDFWRQGRNQIGVTIYFVLGAGISHSRSLTARQPVVAS
jgi:hypothetical protein